MEPLMGGMWVISPRSQKEEGKCRGGVRKADGNRGETSRKREWWEQRCTWAWAPGDLERWHCIGGLLILHFPRMNLFSHQPSPSPQRTSVSAEARNSCPPCLPSLLHTAHAAHSCCRGPCLSAASQIYTCCFEQSHDLLWYDWLQRPPNLSSSSLAFLSKIYFPNSSQCVFLNWSFIPPLAPH